MKPETINNHTILISPLNWGMGHVARCIPLIHQFLLQNNRVIVACDEDQKKIFHNYFPEIEYENHKGYPFKFNGKGNFGSDLFKSGFKLIKRLKLEKIEVRNIVEKYNVDIVISDHRYGFFTKKCKSIFITHQINLPVSWHSKVIDRIHKKLIQAFDIIWILDTPDSKFAGKLSVNNIFKNAEFIGPRSRFSIYKKEEKIYRTVVVISGPNPYSHQFFEQQLILAQKISSKTIFIVPKQFSIKNNVEQIEIIESIDWKKSDYILLRAQKIISRSGYSTIMDLEFLKTENELFPTKGQKEQEYLYELFEK